MCIAKCNSTPSLDAVLSQDLIVTEGPAVEVGDSLEVAYTSWLFQNHALGQVRTCPLGVVLSFKQHEGYSGVRYYNGESLLLVNINGLGALL